MGRRVEPADQRGMPGKVVRLPGEFREDRLGDVGRRCPVATHLPQRGGMHEVQVAAHQFRERRLRPLVRVAAKQFGIGRSGGGQRHLHQQMPADGETAREKCVVSARAIGESGRRCAVVGQLFDQGGCGERRAAFELVAEVGEQRDAALAGFADQSDRGGPGFREWLTDTVKGL